ncbi:hypothetical protein [Candidatus Nanohalococcus occultus]|uniref:SWIM-type domain-containing protein n=1 Tax=Candidatus Nanohalococcus occultus TaxID=2978047 RepID=A0ABY8CHZ0_9ARCH|nr:hypothetical protein SVXNc_0604 [Candidatus Nanohaloarchaeota archaeon SVXNc]
MDFENISRPQRENLHKWGKARKIVDEERIKLLFGSDDRYQFKVEGNTSDYTLGVDIDTGETFCPCAFQGDTCSHQIAAHLFLAEIGLENTSYR